MIEDYTTQADITFSSPLFNKDYDQNEMNYAQAKIRNYYSNKRMIEFECRIDPSIEPLDYITTDGLNYWVEEVDIDFNGGFTGRIKGRVNDNTYFVDAPVISEATLINENNYRIVIDNPNDFAVVVKIYYSGGTLSYNISANGSLLLTYGNASALSTSVQDKIDGGLLEAVYCNFEKQDDTSQTSDNTIILEAD